MNPITSKASKMVQMKTVYRQHFLLFLKICPTDTAHWIGIFRVHITIKPGIKPRQMTMWTQCLIVLLWVYFWLPNQFFILNSILFLLINFCLFFNNRPLPFDNCKTFSYQLIMVFLCTLSFINLNASQCMSSPLNFFKLSQFPLIIPKAIYF